MNDYNLAVISLASISGQVYVKIIGRNEGFGQKKGYAENVCNDRYCTAGGARGKTE